MDIMVNYILLQNLYNCFLIFFKNNVIFKLQFCSNQDSLDEARQRATNYSSSEESNINEIKKSRTKQLNNTVSDNEFESDSDDSRSVIPRPPNLTNTNASQLVDKSPSISNIFINSSVANDIDMEILDGTLISDKSNFY